MRKSISISIGLAALGLTLAACGGGSDAPKAASPAPTTTASTPAPAPAPAPVPTPAADPNAPSPEFANLPEPYQSASYSVGKRVFKQCASCHIAKPGPNLVGPNLHGMFDRQIGKLSGFTYSEALQASDAQWTPELLEQWLASPNTFMPGNRMAFAGVSREKDRHAVIAYLMVETGWTAPE